MHTDSPVSDAITPQSNAITPQSNAITPQPDASPLNTPVARDVRNAAGIPIATAAPYLDAERFAVLVERAPGLAMVDFTAAWCPPCRVLAPHVDALAREFSGSVVVAKVDVDDQPAVAARLGVLGMPTLLFFRDGQVVDRIVGAVPPAQIRAKVHDLQAALLRA